jgi:sugar phosphate isomerase/epimerase
MNRREFINATALGTIAAASTACGTASPRLRKEVRLSTSSILFRELTLEQACSRIAGVGYEAIDIWGPTDGCSHLDEAQGFGGAGLRALLAQHHLKLYAFSTFAGGYEKYASLLGEAGGGVAVQGAPGAAASGELTQRMRDFVESLKPLADLAGSKESWLAIANAGGSLLDSLDSIKAFTDLNAHPRLGLALAPYHLQAIGVPIPEAIRATDSQLLFFYGWQNDVGLRQLPGYGSSDFRPWLDALAAVKYRRYINPFMRGYVAPDMLSASLSRVRNYLLHPA